MVYLFVDPSEENESSRPSECLPSVQPEARSLCAQQAMILVYQFIREGLMNAVNQMQSNHRKVFVGSFFKLWAQESGVEPPDLIHDGCEDWILMLGASKCWNIGLCDPKSIAPILFEVTVSPGIKITSHKVGFKLDTKWIAASYLVIDAKEDMIECPCCTRVWTGWYCNICMHQW